MIQVGSRINMYVPHRDMKIVRLPSPPHIEKIFLPFYTGVQRQERTGKERA